MRCMRCEHEHPVGTLGRCSQCAGILQPHYSEEAVAELVAIPVGRGIDRYRAVLPAETALPSLGEGDTPLLHLERLGKSLGVSNLFGPYARSERRAS